jgi:hypothetical protein
MSKKTAMFFRVLGRGFQRLQLVLTTSANSTARNTISNASMSIMTLPTSPNRISFADASKPVSEKNGAHPSMPCLPPCGASIIDTSTAKPTAKSVRLIGGLPFKARGDADASRM